MLNTKFHIIQLGCASNQADSFRIRQSLLDKKACITSNINDAEVIIILTCGFSRKQYSETIQVISDVNQNRKDSKTEIWIGGCVPAINKNFVKEFEFPIDKVFTPRNFESLLGFNKQSDTFLIKDSSDSPFLKLSSYPIRIVNGCTENCSYCVIKKAGGETKSKSIKQIIQEVILLDTKIDSISLVGEEIGAFGFDTGEFLTNLIDEIVRIKPNIKISFSSIHPKYFINNFEQYVDIFSNKNIVKLLPIAIQSGSNNILKLMRREYLIEDVVNHVNTLLKEIPSIKISTDIMVGYPNETWEDFLLTKELISQIPISSLDCFKFDDMKKIGDTIPEEEKIKRLKIISLTFIRKFCFENNINNQEQLQQFISNNYIPLNLNF